MNLRTFWAGTGFMKTVLWVTGLGAFRAVCKFVKGRTLASLFTTKGRTGSIKATERWTRPLRSAGL